MIAGSTSDPPEALGAALAGAVAEALAGADAAAVVSAGVEELLSAEVPELHAARSSAEAPTAATAAARALVPFIF